MVAAKSLPEGSSAFCRPSRIDGDEGKWIWVGSPSEDYKLAQAALGESPRTLGTRCLEFSGRDCNIYNIDVAIWPGRRVGSALIAEPDATPYARKPAQMLQAQLALARHHIGQVVFDAQHQTFCRLIVASDVANAADAAAANITVLVGETIDGQPFLIGDNAGHRFSSGYRASRGFMKMLSALGGAGLMALSIWVVFSLEERVIHGFQRVWPHLFGMASEPTHAAPAPHDERKPPR
jgi:hypothetical protein